MTSCISTLRFYEIGCVNNQIQANFKSTSVEHTADVINSYVEHNAESLGKYQSTCIVYTSLRMHHQLIPTTLGFTLND